MLSTKGIVQDFAQDLPVAQARLVAATQGPWFAGYTDDKVSEAAWHNKPSWYVLTEKDQIIPPPLQTAMAPGPVRPLSRLTRATLQCCQNVLRSLPRSLPRRAQRTNTS